MMLGMPYVEIEVERGNAPGIARFYDEIFGAPPATHGAAGWQTNEHGLVQIDRWAMRWASDGRGTGPYRPVVAGRMLSHVQWPTTLPTFDELLGLDGLDESNVYRALLSHTERLERDQVFDEDDNVWWGWGEAVTNLGIKQLEPALHRVWSKAIYQHFSERDHQESLGQLERAAGDLTDPACFIEAESMPIDDPVEGVAWISRRAELALSWKADREDQDGFHDEVDPAKSIRLTEGEREWLAGFLVSVQAPSGAMNFEMLDGLFTALVIGPAVVPPSMYMPVIWGTEDGSGPEWDSQEQLQYFMDLLMKHWNAIAARRNADAPHDPFILGSDGAYWAQGFLAGFVLAEAEWEPMLKDRRAAELFMPICALDAEGLKDVPDKPSAEDCAEIIKDLPVILKLIAAYWRYPDRPLPFAEPVRSTKVGRNEPCPCGSGKKFKKCHGA